MKSQQFVKGLLKFIFNVLLMFLEKMTIEVYMHSLSAKKTSKKNNKQYFELKLNSGMETIKCVCFDIKKALFETINECTDIGAPMTNITRPVKDILINTQSKVTKYKPEFTFTKFKKPIVDLAFVNESDVYDEVDIAVTVTNISGIKVSNIGNPYVECVVIDKTKTKCDMKLIGDLRNSVENECVYKFTDVKVLGANRRKILDSSTSTTATKIVDETEEMEQGGANKILEGIVVSIDTVSLMIMHSCGRC